MWLVFGPVLVVTALYGSVQATIDCEHPECTEGKDCAEEEICHNAKCVNPCPGECGVNTECTVTDHKRNCRCLPGHTGDDPIKGCVGFDRPKRMKEYKILTDKKVVRDAAYLVCHEQGMKLATVESMEEQKNVDKAITAAEIAQPGGYWTTGGEQGWKDFKNWGPGEPFCTGDFRCVIVYNSESSGKWACEDCNREFFPLCERQCFTNKGHC